MSSAITYTPSNAKITGNDVEKIKKYVNTGLALQDTLAAVNQTYQGAVDDEGITATELLTTFIFIKNHASKWAPLETKMITTATSLKRFSEDLETYTRPAIEAIKEIPGYSDYELKTSSLTEAQIAMFKVPLPQGDATIQENNSTAEEYINAVIQSLQNKQAEATTVKNELIEFDKDLYTIEVDIGKKAARALASKTLQELRDNTARLAAINNELSDLRKDSTLSVGEILLCCTIVVLVVGYPLVNKIIKNSDKIDALVIEQDKLLSRQAELQRVAAVLNNLQASLSSLRVFVEGATHSMMQLEALWAATLSEVIASKNLLSNTKDFSELAIFIIKMSAVLNRWEKIKHYMTDLTNAFIQKN